MDVEEIKRELDRELEETGWVYKYWKNDDRFEFRNTGNSLSEEQVEDKIEEFMEGLEEDSFKSTLTGKLCIEKTGDGTFIKKRVGENGEPEGEGKKMSEEELEELLKENLSRIDCDMLPTNIAVVDSEDIIDVYSETVRDLKLITVNMEGERMITLRDDGGLQFEST